MTWAQFIVLECWPFCRIQQKNAHLKVELVILVNAGKQLVQATYNLKGDSPLVLHCYEQVEAIINMIQIQHFLNTDAVIRQLAVRDPSHNAQQ